ncbi:hypothetical protein M2103_000061 [Ereboglobus sp. PH5-5]|uniref:glycosyl hydrolase 115 family protein n=1 Tax=Ereboglobus sp. PH5-5 TaxID=2940529 RepID=UPI002407592E|nr:glycosyl hydrolase 115 family protein [Ereboglobus sp. PH5-5]MDF9831857.1 hypothetical protein [Ereboglobus sp. PH5-5]
MLPFRRALALAAFSFFIFHSPFCIGARAPKPLYRDTIYDGAADPVVIHNRAGNNWLMFYTNRRANVPGLDGVSWVHGTPVGIAQSNDGGATWAYRCDARFHGIPLPAGTDPKTLTHWAPDVIEHDGVYHMYLTLVPGVFTDWKHPRDIIHLTSRNLIDWHYQSTLALASDRVIDACVFPLPQGGWRMWYNNERDAKSIYYADSPDLHNWTDRGKCAGVGERPGEGPYVFRWRGHYWMLVDLWRGIGVYRSDDLLNWTPQPGDPLLGKPGKGADDGVNGGHCGVVVDHATDRAYCFYFTHPGRNGTISPDDKNNLELRRSSIQVVELREKDGAISCDRDAPTYVKLSPPADSAVAANFTLAGETAVARIHYSDMDAKVVSLAANHLAADIERVTGKRPVVISTLKTRIQLSDAPVILIGTLGKSPFIDQLLSTQEFDLAVFRGSWESFLITALDNNTLVIAGSDPRGTAFGVYELSRMIGVSPWHWWADVTPEKKTSISIPAGTRVFGPPSVKYRGIFINDEDWGLQPWAAKTFEPETGGIGPKTYEKVFELLLRLKANTLWPAMHACSPAFNSNPANAALASDYAIVMGSSHAEPMLRNNVTEWTAPHKDYNYATNRDGVLAYWEERAKTNGRYENIYTIGMRGIHDSGMQGGGTKEEQIARLEKIFADQRALIAKHVSPGVERVPQMFCAYKEVLDLYRGGLRVPDDVTIMFPDDNFGYIRNFPSDADRAAMRDGKRTGGFGIYYHLSYLGRPMAYLWLSTTPPALIWEEMNKAHQLGADRIWIANVGDIKPAEITTEFFLQMAWDIGSVATLPNMQIDFLRQWAAREFGAEHAPDIAQLMDMYYRYNFERRPEHLQWWLPREKPKPSTFTPAQRERRDELARKMNELLATIRERIPAEKQDAFYQLVEYPVQGSILANNRYFTGEEAALKHIAGDKTALNKLGYQADVLNLQLARITHRYNNLIAGGKWRHLMQLEPADNDWKSMRISKWRVPNFQQPLPSAPKDPLTEAEENGIEIWTTGMLTPIDGLGRSGTVTTITPATTSATSILEAKTAPTLIFKYTLAAQPNSATLRIHVLPTHAIDGSGKLRIAYAIDGAPEPQLAELIINDGKPEWAQGVLANERTFDIPLPPSALTAGEHTLHLHGIDSSVVIDRVTIE